MNVLKPAHSSPAAHPHSSRFSTIPADRLKAYLAVMNQAFKDKTTVRVDRPGVNPDAFPRAVLSSGPTINGTQTTTLYEIKGKLYVRSVRDDHAFDKRTESWTLVGNVPSVGSKPTTSASTNVFAAESSRAQRTLAVPPSPAATVLPSMPLGNLFDE